MSEERQAKKNGTRLILLRVSSEIEWSQLEIDNMKKTVIQRMCALWFPRANLIAFISQHHILYLLISWFCKQMKRGSFIFQNI